MYELKGSKQSIECVKERERECDVEVELNDVLHNFASLNPVHEISEQFWRRNATGCDSDNIIVVLATNFECSDLHGHHARSVRPLVDFVRLQHVFESSIRVSIREGVLRFSPRILESGTISWMNHAHAKLTLARVLASTPRFQKGRHAIIDYVIGVAMRLDQHAPPV